MENSNQEILQAIQMLATKMDEGLNQLRKDMNDGFEKVNQRIDKIEARLDKLEEKVDDLEKRLVNIENKVDSIQDEVANLKEWKTTVDEKLNHLVDIEKITKHNSYEILKLKVKQEYQ